nr:dihydropteroate synthase [Thiopseudomonas alkaliphila]
MAQQSWLQCGARRLDLTEPKVMGIVNMTPDSFSDGGHYNHLDQALLRAQQLCAEGAAIIDIGGESTRPGAAQVSEQQELDRVVPLVERIAQTLDVVISVDTSTPSVMRESIAAGAGLINDVRSLRREGALEAVQDTQAAVCLMHMLGEPQTMQQQPEYADVTAEVLQFLQEKVQLCEQAGIAKSRLLIDPGFGFAKNLTHNLTLFKQQQQLAVLGLPLLVGVSRKSMIGQVLDKPVEQRLFGSLGLAVMALERGAKVLRVHDVAATVDAVKLFNAVMAAQ